MTSFAGNQMYTFDALNRLQTYANDTDTVSYKYYADGLRASKDEGGQKTNYVYLNGKVIEEIGASGNVLAQTIWGNKPLFRKDFTTNKTGYYLYNSHGDVTEITDTKGNTLNSYEYDSWGNILSQTQEMPNPFTYTGEMYDDKTQMYYLRARYYDPTVGRFISEDTNKGQVDNPLSLNRYTYGWNNPVRFTDPSGHDPGGAGAIQGKYIIGSDGIVRTRDGKIAMDYYREWYETDSDNMLDVMRGTDKQKNGIAAATAWDWAADNGALLESGGVSPKVKAPVAKQTTIKQVLKAPNSSTKVITTAEVKSPNPIKASNVSSRWNEYLGSGQHTNINPITGKVDTNRIWSADGNRAIRFGNHEMNSIGTNKGHYHEETWKFDPSNNSMTITNTLIRIQK